VKRARTANTVTSFFSLALYDFLNLLTQRFSARRFSVSARGQEFFACGNFSRGRESPKKKCPEL
jgi:hypothetical protein